MKNHPHPLCKPGNSTGQRKDIIRFCYQIQPKVKKFKTTDDNNYTLPYTLDGQALPIRRSHTTQGFGPGMLHKCCPAWGLLWCPKRGWDHQCSDARGELLATSRQIALVLQPPLGGWKCNQPPCCFSVVSGPGGTVKEHNSQDCPPWPVLWLPQVCK